MTVKTPASKTDWTTVNWSRWVRELTIAGRRVRYLDRGNGHTIVLVHGLGGCWQWWLNNIGALAADHRVIAIDLPGFGGSDPLPNPAAMATQAEVVAELIEALDAGPVTVVGHSMGGLVALSLASSRPDLVSRVVLANGGGVPMSAAHLLAVTTLLRVMGVLLARPGVVRAIVRRPRLRHAFFAGSSRRPEAFSGPLASELVPRLTAPGFADALAAGAQAVREIDPTEVRCPVLLLWGEDDPLVTIDQARELEAILDDAVLEPLSGLGHCPMVEAPAQFNAFVMDFARS